MKLHRPEHVAEACGTTGQLRQADPQLNGLVSETHVWPQKCWLAGHAQTLAPALQTEPIGHSVGSRQPGRQRLAEGSQK